MDDDRMLRCAGCGVETPMPLEFRTNGYDVYRCPGCRSTITSPLPAPEVLAAHYAGYNERYTAGMGAERYAREMPLRWEARLRVLRRLGARGRLADLAGSNGMFGGIAARQGFEVSVSDFLDEPRDLGFCVAVPGDLNRPGGIPFDDGAFDTVTLWSCIEHVLEPDAALGEMFRLCVPGGIVGIDTPLVGDACERLFAARSHWINPPDHLHVFSAPGLRRAVERAGFEVAFHAPFFERTALRWIARRGRNVAVAGLGALLRLGASARWRAGRDERDTPAGDIQFLVARKPAGTAGA